MSSLLADCKTLIEVRDLSDWNTTKVTNLNDLFFG